MGPPSLLTLACDGGILERAALGLNRRGIPESVLI
jgi:hypothetical protein